MLVSPAFSGGAAPASGRLLRAFLIALALVLPGAASLQDAAAQDAPKGKSAAEDDPLEELLGQDESDPQAVEIIDRYLEAVGGKEALAAIQDRIERFNNKKLTPTGETVMKMSRYLSRPVKIREEWELPGMGITKDNAPLTFTQVYDGEKAWVKAMGFVSPLSGKTLTVFVWDKHIDDFFASWKDNGWTAKYVGPAEIGGRPAEVIELVRSRGTSACGTPSRPRTVCS